MAALRLVQPDEDVWSVFDGNNMIAVADIYLDYCAQVQEVLLYAPTPPATKLAVLQLALSHAAQYVKQRTTSALGGLMTATYADKSLTRHDSVRFMDFACIPPDIMARDQDTIVDLLKSLGIDVINARYRTAREALYITKKLVGVVGLSYKVIASNKMLKPEIIVQFKVQKSNQFTYWNDMSRPSYNEHDLDVVPSYHPIMKGWEKVGMVNGCTDAYIGRSVVERVFSPKASRAHCRSLGSSWTHVRHPFRACGRSIELALLSNNLRSDVGVVQLAGFLRAALNLDQTYIGINGGFRAPMKCGHNRLVELNRRSPYRDAKYHCGGHLTRGSEEHCVWAHRVLGEEGMLKESYVPAWLAKEGWLEIYKKAEVRHGLF